MVLNSLNDKELLNLRYSVQEKIENSDELIFSSLMGVAGFMPDEVELRAELAAIDEEIKERHLFWTDALIVLSCEIVR